METIYRSSDGKTFKSRRLCKKYERALEEIEIIDHLHFEIVGGYKFYKINSEAELYFFDHMFDDEGTNTLYDIFMDLQEKDFRFPVWLREDGKASKSSMIAQRENEIEEFRKEIETLQQEIDHLKSLDSRKKTLIVDKIENEEQEQDLDENEEQENKQEVKEEI